MSVLWLLCADIDECTEGGCSHIGGSVCENTPGSFDCHCRPGFRLSGDARLCEGMHKTYCLCHSHKALVNCCKLE